MKTRKEVWRCVENCGACCHLDPQDRPDLEEYLSVEELEIYLSMVGEDGWCINLDHQTKQCTIYEQRPGFCRVHPDTFQDMYGIEDSEFNDFAIACCRQQITGVYGEDSSEITRYNKEILQS
ncbi:MAG: YkgJ family cysteine cluster protein [Cyanobacteria bacterium P01_F01_bin.143]